eukprot:scaffold112891_cov51-Phaeocystis_antarctica.AAC.1
MGLISTASVLMVLALALPLTFESAVSFVCMQLPRPSPSPGSASSVISCIVRSWQRIGAGVSASVWGLVGSGSGCRSPVALWGGVSPCGLVSSRAAVSEPNHVSSTRSCNAIVFLRDRATDANLLI